MIKADGTQSTSKYCSDNSTIVRVGIWSAFLFLCVVYLIWGWSDEITDFGGDSAAYMMMARLYSPFTIDSAVLSEAVRATPFPPLFSAVIGLFGASFLAGHLIVIASLLAAIFCLQLWLRDEGLGTLASAGTALAFALMPGTYFQALTIMTENPYLAVSLFCIVVERRAEARGKDRPVLWWITVAAVAAAPLIRTAALPLLAAFAIRVSIIRPRRWPWLIVVSGMPVAVWLVWSALNRTGISVYASQAGPIYSGDVLAQLTGQIAKESWWLLIGWVEDWLGPGRAGVLASVAVLAGAICLLGCAKRLAALRFDAIYVALYIVVLILWPFPDAAQRLSYVIVPVLLAQGAMLIHSFEYVRRKPGSLVVAALCMGVLTIMLVPTLLLTVARFRTPVIPASMNAVKRMPGWYRTTDARNGILSTRFLAKILDDLPRLNSQVPAGECIFSVKPTLVTLYSGRMSYFPPAYSTSEAQFQHDIGKCHYAYGLAINSPSFPEAFYPVPRLKDQATLLSAVESDNGTYPIPFAQLVKISERH